MNFFQDDDEGIIRITLISLLTVIIICFGVGIFGHLRDLHDERMVDKGCKEVVICNNGEKHWECGKDK